ncbi:MAG: hypothetical protein SFV17_11715 [Candidatus Obscuribacter sp.]|nr:hypothetical protein [Candidatus Melainabacteria bacterium]MDX1987345.1 hypothetical protein [Candidatus Obscuribacter sp.]
MLTAKVDLQQIRKSVLRSQMLALESQAQAIYYLGTEHRAGIDLGRNPEIYLIVQDVKDIADTARKTTEDAKSLTPEEVLSRLQGLQSLAHSVVARAEEAYRHIQVDSDARLEENLAENLDKGENPTEMPEVPADTRHLKARAGMACHSAEIDQHLTFKLQVRAICDLALELSFTAAAEAGHDYPQDEGYWK